MQASLSVSIVENYRALSACSNTHILGLPRFQQAGVGCSCYKPWRPLPDKDTSLRESGPTRTSCPLAASPSEMRCISKT